MTNVNCIFCGGNKIKVIAAKGILHKSGEPLDFRNVICKRCGLVYINPRPTDQEYLDLYAKYGETRHSLRSEESIISYIQSVENKPKGKEISEFVSKYVPKGGRALDIGCGVGTVARALRDTLDMEACGIEPDPLLAKTVSKYFNFEIFSGTLDDFLSKNKTTKFDLLILHHVFEHFTDPFLKLRSLEGLLKEGGVLYIEVPNILDFKKPVNQFFDLLHPYSYSLPTLNKVLNLGGFKIIAHNKEKQWRLQVIAAPKSDLREELNDPSLNSRKVVARTRRFLFKRRTIDIFNKFIRPFAK